MSTSTNHLLSRLLHTTPEAAEHLEQVGLLPGSWPISGSKEQEGHVYFPEVGLIGLFWQGPTLKNVRMAWLGCHACWWPGYWSESALQAQVLLAGHAQRIAWSVLKAEPKRYAAWMLQTAAASQQLIHQMAQMAFCADQHNTLQRLASSLLVVMNQSPHGPGQVSLSEIAHWLTCPEVDVRAAALALQAHGALLLSTDADAVTQLHSMQPPLLANLACSCHLQVVQGQEAGDSAKTLTKLGY